MQQYSRVFGGARGGRPPRRQQSVIGFTRGDRAQRDPGRLRPGLPALDDRCHLAVAAPEQRLDLPGVPAGHHDQDLVHPRRRLERRHAPLDQRGPAQGEQLLRQARAQPLADAAAQHHRDHPHVPDSTRPGRRALTMYQRAARSAL